MLPASQARLLFFGVCECVYTVGMGVEVVLWVGGGFGAGMRDDEAPFALRGSVSLDEIFVWELN